LSGSEKGDSKSAAARASGRTRKVAPGETKNKKQRAGDLGRALRTVYDDTLREPVPDDFAALLGKLS
jgi:Anti-sigma factor NepR